MKPHWMPASVLAIFALSGCRQSPPRITVSGSSPYGQEGIRIEATVLVRTTPELAVITLGCETRAARASDARARNDATMSAIIASVERRGVRKLERGEGWKGLS